MPAYVRVGGLRVADTLHDFVNNEALPGTGVEAGDFWTGVEEIITTFAPRNRELLAERDRLQSLIDEFHRSTPGRPDPERYTELLVSSGYVRDEPADFEIETSGVDSEIAAVAGPQLVVPLLNARYTVNAANARWGSLYDALYGSDVIDESEGRERGSGYNPARGQEVVAWVRRFLDEHVPLAAGSHAAASSYSVDADGLRVTVDGALRRLAEPSQFVGYSGEAASPSVIVLAHHGLHIELHVDRESSVGRDDPASIADVVLESAVTTIVDLEDSVAAVDVADKVSGYRNWLQLMQGGLEAEVVKGDRSFVRVLNRDRTYRTLAGGSVTLPGRALLLVRNVGLLMTTDALLDGDDREVPEGILDTLLTVLGGVHDLRGPHAGGNSRTGSIYVVKPKLHGPDEVRFTCELFERVEQLLHLAPGTIKVGIMDEERRTSVNLKACVHAARDRIAFVNTGFLDRTGDEIHTSMHAGAVVRKSDMRDEEWIRAYEDSNVAVALACGFRGRAQIGKGMWAAPDNMADMVANKIGQPRAGASCAWVPSPTAATLHAVHYHQVDVDACQQELAGRPRIGRSKLLRLPLAEPADWPAADVQHELDNNVQGVLGYVVRWVDLGVGCSKVPDLGGTPLMEDRATCRISSQHVANWLHHGVITEDQVEDSLRRMAAVVDSQNAGEPGYQPMAPGFDGPAFSAARALLFEDIAQPNGYTEPLLHRYRLVRKHQDCEVVTE